MKNFKQYQEELLALRRHFHRYPELALKEVNTSAYIREYLTALGYEIKQVPPTGLIAEHPSMKHNKRLVVIRAEMDALPIQEATGLAYASCNPGCMHACGHDGIMAAALVLAKILAEEGADFPLQVRFLFEPAEEIGEGAGRMIAGGALENPRADAFVMFHYAGDNTIGMAVHRGQASAMIGGMKIFVDGKSSHWCQADKGIDSIYAASLVVNAVHDINENYHRKAPCLIGLGTIHGGEYPNIIAGHVEMSGNIRACIEEDYYAIKELMEKQLRDIEARTGASIRMVFPKEPVLPIVNDKQLTECAAQAGRVVFQERFMLEGEDKLFLSGDNAYRYFQKTRGIFVVFLAGDKEENHPLHHPKFRLDENILLPSLETLYRMLLKIDRQFREIEAGTTAETAVESIWKSAGKITGKITGKIIVSPTEKL